MRPATEQCGIIKPGIYFDFPIDVYHLDPCPVPSLSQSCAKTIINASPAHAMYQHPRFSKVRPDDDGEEKYSAARAIGDVAHKLILGRGKEIWRCHFSDWRTKDSKAARQEGIDQGFLPVLDKHYETAEDVAMMFRRNLQHHEAGPLPEGSAEVVLAWEEDGVWFRSLVDHLSKDRLFVTDIKTTSQTVGPLDAGKKMAEDGWDIQAAMIDRGLSVLDPQNAGRRTYRFISIEQNPPFGLVVNQISEAALTIGRQKLQCAVHLWRECLKSNRWPAYPPFINTPEYPAWSVKQWQEREMAILWSEKE